MINGHFSVFILRNLSANDSWIFLPTWNALFSWLLWQCFMVFLFLYSQLFLYSIFGTFLSALKSATTTALHNCSYYSTPNYHHLSLGCHDSILCQTYPFTPLIKSLWRQYMKCKINPTSIKSLQDLASFHYIIILPCLFIRVTRRNNKQKWWW